MHTHTYILSFPHGALQHKDCRLFIWEKFAHVFLPPFLRVLFYSNYYGFLSIWKKKQFTLPASLHHPLCPFSIEAYDITLAENEDIREAERWSQLLSYSELQFTFSSAFPQIGCIFQAPGVRRKFYSLKQFLAKITSICQLIFPIKEKCESTKKLQMQQYENNVLILKSGLLAVENKTSLINVCDSWQSNCGTFMLSFWGFEIAISIINNFVD